LHKKSGKHALIPRKGLLNGLCGTKTHKKSENIPIYFVRTKKMPIFEVSKAFFAAKPAAREA
jgi:hypothetical protein